MEGGTGVTLPTWVWKAVQVWHCLPGCGGQYRCGITYLGVEGSTGVALPTRVWKVVQVWSATPGCEMQNMWGPV